MRKCPDSKMCPRNAFASFSFPSAFHFQMDFTVALTECSSTSSRELELSVIYFNW